MSRQSPNGTYWKKRAKKYEAALRHILWIKDCGVDGTDEFGVFRNWPETERDAMYSIAKDALSRPQKDTA